MKTVKYTTKTVDGENYYFATIYDQGFRFDSMIGLKSEKELKDRVKSKYPEIIELINYCLN